MNPLVGTTEIINQLSGLLASLDADIYKQKLEIFDGATIGKHFRHIIDFYTCIINGEKIGLIDYSLRQRNIEIENLIPEAEFALAEIQKNINALDTKVELQIKTDFSLDEDTNRQVVKSSIGRELMYGFDHSIHHIAIIKIGIKQTFPHVVLDQQLGYAPSTLKNNASQKSSNLS